MMKAKDLKRLIGAIPDNAVIMIDGKYDVEITGFDVDPMRGYDIFNLTLTEGWSITKDAILDGMFTQLRGLTDEYDSLVAKMKENQR